MADDLNNKKLIDAIENASVDAKEEGKLTRSDIDTQTAVLGAAILNLQKQGADLHKKDNKISLQENLGSLLEVAATFKSQKLQAEHEEKTKMTEVDDILERKTKEDRKWYGSMLDFMRKGDKDEDQLSAQQTEKTKKDNAKSKMEFKTLKSIGKSVGGMLKSMTQWDKLKGAAKFTFFGALMAGFMVGLIKFLDTKTWKDFRAWVFDPQGLSKTLREWGLSWKNIKRALFGEKDGPFSWEGKNMGFFPWLGKIWGWMVIKLKSFGKGVKKLYKDIKDPKKDWLETLTENWKAIFGIGGILAGLALTIGFGPLGILAGVYVAGKWLFFKPLKLAISSFIGAIGNIGKGLTAMTAPVAPAGAPKGGTLKAPKAGASFKTGKGANQRSFRFSGQTNRWHDITKGAGNKMVKATDIHKMQMSKYQKAVSKFPKLAKILSFGPGGAKVISKLWGPLAAVFGAYQTYELLTSDASPADKIKGLGGLILGTLGTYALAAAGAAIGTAILPGVGTFIGGLGGAGIGWLGGQWVGEQLASYLLTSTGAGKGLSDKDSIGARLGAGDPIDMSLGSGNNKGTSIKGGRGNLSGSALQDQYKGYKPPKIPMPLGGSKRVKGVKSNTFYGFPKNPPKPMRGDPNYRKKWMLRKDWLISQGRDIEEYLQSAPENYGQELNQIDRYNLYGQRYMSAQEMFNKDHPPIFNAPTSNVAHSNTYTWGAKSSRSGNGSTAENLSKIGRRS